jgi:anti-sigma regulatory factor (Ser/Thr protein kinase)
MIEWRRIVGEDGEDTAFFALSFSPNVSLVSTVRRFVGDFYRQIISNQEITSQLAVATHELLDNAVLYSHDGNSSIRVGVRIEPNGTRVTIDTRNRASADNIGSVRKSLDALAAAPDASAHYQALMRSSANRADGSGLGLARVRAEADMAIKYEIEDDWVHLHASARFPGEQR